MYKHNHFSPLSCQMGVVWGACTAYTFAHLPGHVFGDPCRCAAQNRDGALATRAGFDPSARGEKQAWEKHMGQIMCVEASLFVPACI